MARIKLSAAIQKAKEQAPMFQDWNIRLDIEHSTKVHATKFAMGTRGNVGSIPVEISWGGGNMDEMTFMGPGILDLGAQTKLEYV